MELDDGPERPAAVVFLATPLGLSGIEVLGITDTDRAAADAVRYETIHATFVSGELRPEAFGGGTVPHFVLTTRGVGSVLSVERLGDGAGGPLYKTFSLEELGEREIGSMFARVAGVERVRWYAYPRLIPTELGLGFRLARGLYYPSAMEMAVSTMETQAIAGVATTNLATHDIAADR